MASTAGITLSATVSGLPTGGLERLSLSFTNTSGAYQQQVTEVTTALASPGSVTLPSSAQFVLMVPDSTNTHSWRLTATTLENGMLMSSNGAVFMRIPGGSALRFYTTAGTTFQLSVVTF